MKGKKAKAKEKKTLKRRQKWEKWLQHTYKNLAWKRYI
jgi:hypothetical protein